MLRFRPVNLPDPDQRLPPEVSLPCRLDRNELPRGVGSNPTWIGIPGQLREKSGIKV